MRGEPLEQDSLISRMVIALQDAEEIKTRVEPAYQRHSEAQLRALVQITLENGRDPGLLVIDILG